MPCHIGFVSCVHLAYLHHAPSSICHCKSVTQVVQWFRVPFASMDDKCSLETYVINKPNMFNVWVKNCCGNPKLNLLGGGGGGSTPTGCLTGSGVIFGRGLGGGVSPASMEKTLKWCSGLIFDFNLSFNIEILKITVSPTLILTTQILTQFSKNQPSLKIRTSTQEHTKYLLNDFQYSLLAPMPVFHLHHTWYHL